MTPRAGFAWPVQVRATETGCVALSRELVLHAVTAGQYVRGVVTPLIAALLRGDAVAEVAVCFGVPAEDVGLVRVQMQRQGFISAT